MGKLLERLQDAARSGVYRAASDAAILEATRGTRIDVVPIELTADVFGAVAKALNFPEWFGGNWDALEDCLSDLSWRKAGGTVLVLRNCEALDQDRLGILIDVLASSAEFWAGRGKPFFAVFIDPARKLSLPELFRGS
ncbi:MAG: barstar family protein [Betaproteobacteria bacterium]|nr:MAG: barstar family protein [Betaproteobacteria bacterium]